MKISCVSTLKAALVLVITAVSLFSPQGLMLKASAAGGAKAELAKLENILQPIVDAAREDGIEVAAAVKDLSGTYGGGSIEVGSTGVYLAASTIKMAVVTALMQEVEAGTYALEDTLTITPEMIVGGAGTLQKEAFPQNITIERLARLMIVQSDNTATNALIDLVGFERVQKLIDDLEFDAMQLGRKMMTAAKPPEGENYVDASELLELLEKIYDGSLVSVQSRDQILNWMKEQEVKTKFGAALPGKPIAHKTGELGDVSHDIGYFLVPGREMAVVVLTKVTKPEDAGKAQELGNPIVQRIAKAVYNYASDYPSAPSDPTVWPAMTLALLPLIEAAEMKGVRVSVAVKDLSSESSAKEVLLGSRQSYMPASTIKLILAAALMKEVDAGTLKLDQRVTVDPEDVVGGTGSLQKEKFPQDITLERLVRMMITQSDNTATNVLIDVVGLDKVDALTKQLNLQVMHLGRKMFAAAPTPAQDNYIDASDLVVLLEEIYKGSFLTADSRDQIINWMKAQEVKTKFGAVLEGKPIAHKTGENANVTHDTGYFLIPGHEAAISVLTEVTTTNSFDKAQEIGNPVVQEIANTVYTVLSQKSVFTDIPTGHWAQSIIEAAAASSLVKGTSTTTFSPDRPVTRAEFVSMLVRTLQLESTAVPIFNDVQPSSWFGEDIGAAYEAGIVRGRTPEEFAPFESITRAEMTTMIVRAYEKKHGNLTGAKAGSYKDVSTLPAWSADAIAKAEMLGLVSGYADGTFRPTAQASRAEGVKLIVYLRGLI